MDYENIDSAPPVMGRLFKFAGVTFLACVTLPLLIRRGYTRTIPADTPPRPSFIVFLADDMGWGDLSCYGHPTQRSPNLCRMAKEGVRYTQWYAPDSVCTPSRGALLTGRMPSRIGLVPNASADSEQTYRVLWAHSRTGLPHSEITIAEALKDVGYRTGIVGKWHLGVNAVNRTDGTYLPRTQGFDYVGHNLPFTHHWMCDETGTHMPTGPHPQRCYLYYGDKLKQQPYSTNNLTEALVNDAKEFMRAAGKEPFFLYFAFPHTHAASFASPEYMNTSARGIYGDMVADMDGAVGEVMDEVRRLGIGDNTLAVFTADNGPMVQACSEGGNSGLLRGGKATSLEGGVRVPGIVWWPGRLKGEGAVDHRTISSLDIFPTFMELAGAKMPVDRQYDGRSLVPVLTGAVAKAQYTPPTFTPSDSHRALLGWGSYDRVIFHHCGQRLMAVRVGKYKVHYYIQEEPAPNCTDSGTYGTTLGEAQSWDCTKFTIKLDPPAVYNLDIDPSETFRLGPDSKVARAATEAANAAASDLLTRLAVDLRQLPQLGQFDNGTLVCCNPPSCVCNYSGPSTPFNISALTSRHSRVRRGVMRKE